MTASPRALRRALVIALALVCTVTAGTAAADDSELRAAAERAGSRFTGVDGVEYDTAPLVTTGVGNELYWGPDFDNACARGGGVQRAMKKLNRAAALIERSGRDVVFTVAPNKLLIRPEDQVPLPHGRCDRVGIKAQKRVLDDFPRRFYLPLRRTLISQQEHQIYWRKDLHWTTVGGAIFARALASRLDTRLGNRQRYSYGQETRLAMLDTLGEPETLETATPATRVRVQTRGPWKGYPDLVYRTSWRTEPARRTWPGRTLVLGDSFTWYALENLRPLFHRGEFIWMWHTKHRAIMKSLRRADTVVIEVYQTLLSENEFIDPFLQKAARKLARSAGSR